MAWKRSGVRIPLAPPFVSEWQAVDLPEILIGYLKWCNDALHDQTEGDSVFFRKKAPESVARKQPEQPQTREEAQLLSPQDILCRKFMRAGKGKAGYEIEAIDEFLDTATATVFHLNRALFTGEPVPANTELLTPKQVRRHQLPLGTPRRGFGSPTHFDRADVDSFIDEIEKTLVYLNRKLSDASYQRGRGAGNGVVDD